MLGDGTIVCQFEINKDDWDKSELEHKSAMIFSNDGGKSWSGVVIVTEEPDMYYWDQRPNVMCDGSTIIDFFWTLDGKNSNIKISMAVKALTVAEPGVNIQF